MLESDRWKTCIMFFICFYVCRQESFTNSDISLERRFSDEAAKDTHAEPSSSISHMSRSPSLYSNGRMASTPFSAPCSFPLLPSSSSSPLHHCAASVFQFDKPFSPAPFEPGGDTQTPPPLPPKPNHLSELLSNGGAPRSKTFSPQQFPVSVPVFSRRTSLPGLDHMTMGTDLKSERVCKQQDFVEIHKWLQLVAVFDSMVPLVTPSVCHPCSPIQPKIFTF